jgi:long-chain acyl-CoA synthetase
METTPSLDVSSLFRGVRLLVIGGTGFLGKIFWVLLLDRYPEVGTIYLVVRPGKGGTSEQRFWSQIATSRVLEPLRRQHGAGFEDWLREKVIPIDGDVSKPDCGIGDEAIGRLKGQIDAVINVAGVVDFNPPLDEAIRANAFGAQNLVSVARKLGDVPVMHTSTCYVAGKRRTAVVDEVSPLDFPFPKANELDRSLWDPEREIAECLDVIAAARKRCEDSLRQSEYAARAKANLLSRNEPTTGPAFEAELASVKRKIIAALLIDAGIERASHWGWYNIYTYTKSIGEQVVARSGLRHTIVRPACSESCQFFPEEGWNEGVNTSSPLIFLAIKGALGLPGEPVPLDFIPADYVCAGMVLSLAELLDGSHKPVYQYGTSDINPVTAQRIGELIGLYKRKFYQRREGSKKLFDALQRVYETEVFSEQLYGYLGPHGYVGASRAIAGALRATGLGAARPAVRSLQSFAQQQERIAFLMDLFAPFTTQKQGPFSCANTRTAFARLSAADQRKLPWFPERVDWRVWMHEVHMPGFERWVLPEMDKKLVRKERPVQPHATLVSMLGQMVDRYGHALALQRIEPDGLSRLTYLELQDRARGVASRLAALGVTPGTRVLLCAKNHPDWPIAYFGVLIAGGVAVPVDGALDTLPAGNVLRQSKARVAIVDPESLERLASVLSAADVKVALLAEITAPAPGLTAPAVEVKPGDLASIIYTSGTTGEPKGVMLTHRNFTALVAALGPVFPLHAGDRVLSVLPLHHTFEFTCGLLLPISRGARVIYLDELTADRLSHALRVGRVQALVGVPALWQLLERRITGEVKAQGPVVEGLFEALRGLNLKLRDQVGLDAGKLLFGAVHRSLGGQIRYLISGGAALPRETQDLFRSLGLSLVEGYGLTEASPVLTAARPSVKDRGGHVGRPVPGVEIKIDAPDALGVGEVLARGPNVMAGYEGMPEETARVIDAEGWLHTGDLGKIDRRGQLALAGRAKDVVVGPSGENLYPDDIEQQLGAVPNVRELVIVGLPGPHGERLACLAVPESPPEGTEDSLGPDERAAQALASLRSAISRLPARERPSLVEITHDLLPRTATRKVRRPEARQILLARQAALPARPLATSAQGEVARIIAEVAQRPGIGIGPRTDLAHDLGFDSLLLTELHVALERRFGAVSSSALGACLTVADVEALVEQGPSRSAQIIDEERDEREERAARRLPWWLRGAGKAVIDRASQAFYGGAMSTRVVGRALIPHNRSTIVVANHASHLDMGLVRHALGRYGEGLVTMAAADYFFREGSLTREVVENFTDLRPFDRGGVLRHGLDEAGRAIEEGRSLLIFPEGTRSPDGEIQEFRPVIGQLALEHGVDILPLYLGGTHEALPKGASVPSRRKLVVRIGPPLEARALRRRLAGLGPHEAWREAARLAREAVLALRAGSALTLE